MLQTSLYVIDLYFSNLICLELKKIVLSEFSYKRSYNLVVDSFSTKRSISILFEWRLCLESFILIFIGNFERRIFCESNLKTRV